ncbi:MAG: dipeptidase [Gemmatimonadota bacterium]|nr:dipeptidase [Gemmatimonadota bacterium]
MRFARAILVGGLIATARVALSQSGADAQLIARAQAIQQRVITIDTHDDIPGNFATPEVDPLNFARQVNLEKMKAGGLDMAFFAVFVGQTPRTPENYEKAKADAMQKFAAIHRMAEQMYPDRISIAYSPEDVERIHKSGKLVAGIGIENGYVIGTDLSLIKKYYDLGARYMTLAHTANNDICDSSTDPKGPEHNGMSKFGASVVEEMNRVGMMVDISHVSKACMMQATAKSRAPVIASHSSTIALANVPRNMDDEQLLALKKNGGVMQTVAFSGYVRAVPAEKTAALDSLRRVFGMTGRGGGGQRPPPLPDSVRAAYQKAAAALDEKWPPPTVKDFVDHIDHAVKLIGVEHVGISSDFDGGGGVRGWNDASETLNVTIELVRRGYSEEDIRKMWGGNLLRVWARNAKVARELKLKT